MTDTVCADPAEKRPFDRSFYARCQKAAEHGIDVLLSANGGPKGRARGAKHRNSLIDDLRKFLIRILAGCDEKGHEPHTHYATARGRAKVRGIGKTAANDRSRAFESAGLIDRANEKVRRGELQRNERDPLIKNPLHWVPTLWRIGPTLRHFFDDLFEIGTEIAKPFLDNQNRTRNSPPESNFSLPSEIPSSSSFSTDQVDSLEVSGFEKLSRDPVSIAPDYRQIPVAEPPSPDVPKVFALDEPIDIQAVISATAVTSAMAIGGEHRAHAHGRDLGHVLRGTASEGTLDRVSRAVTGVEFRVHVRRQRSMDRYRRGSSPAAPDPIGLDASPSPALEAACKCLETAPPRLETPPPEISHPMGHNRPPADPSPLRGDLSSDLNPIRDDDGRTAFDRRLADILVGVFRSDRA